MADNDVDSSAVTLCASSFNLEEFWDWVEGVTFTPIPTTPCVEGGVEVVEDYMESSPLAACETCREKWEESGVENSSYKVKWEELISWDIKYEEDPRMDNLVNAVKAANLLTYEDGLCKGVIWNMVNLISNHGLCPKHKLDYYVYINSNTPGKANDAGAVNLRVLRSDKEEEELFDLKGCPDLVVFSPPAPASVFSPPAPVSSASFPAPPVLTLAIVENKKTAKPLQYGRDCQLGQALFYAMATQLRALAVMASPPCNTHNIHG